MTVTAIGQLLGDIIAEYMSLDASRVILANELFDAPKDSGLYVLIIHDPIGNETVGINQSFDFSAGTETMARVSHERFAIEVVSRGPDAQDRYHEIQMALKSVMATQLAETNNVKLFRGGDPMNLTAIEGSGPLRRYRIPVIVTNIETKSASVDMIDKFSALDTNVDVEA